MLPSLTLLDFDLHYSQVIRLTNIVFNRIRGFECASRNMRKVLVSRIAHRFWSIMGIRLGWIESTGFGWFPRGIHRRTGQNFSILIYFYSEGNPSW